MLTTLLSGAPTAVGAGGSDPVVSTPTRTQPLAVPAARPAQSACGKRQRLKENGQPWVCTFADDFDGKRLNRKRWQAVATRTSGFVGGGECFRGGRDNVRVKRGTLRLTIRKLKAPVTCHAPRGGTFTTRYTSGSVTTHDRFSQTYGRFEVRAKFPKIAVKGLQSAIWMTPQTPIYGAWPRSGEIDIVEHYTHKPRRAIPFLHYMTVPNMSQTNRHCMLRGRAKFHTYTTIWEPGRIRIWVDKKLCINHWVNPLSPWSSPQPFDHPFIFNLTHLLGIRENAFDPARTPLPSTFVVDYWRAWQ